ncbi:tigger transposable element-derived protein 1-like [Macrobrachium nipponense]|uniref:tigger transposable element-derived protein 1-like n=1 Tax=Macrobrachium nipponense TaxID=159736 RepID=UPI0030C8652B
MDEVHVLDLAKIYNRITLTICSILKKKEEIKAMEGVLTVSTQWLHVLDSVEKLLLIWINNKQLAGDTITENIICEKARLLFGDFVKKEPGSSVDAEKETFKTRHGWFENFKKRTGICNVVQHGESASSDMKAAEAFVTEFKRYVDSESYIPQQVLNCDETGLFWKKMHRRPFITAEEKALPGHKSMKDRLTLPFCANASGDCKIKPLLVYHLENPRAFKKNRWQKKQLKLIWRSTNKA